MRIVRVLIIGSILLFVSTIGWYISQPVIFGLTRGLNSTISADANAVNVATAIEYASIAWGPLMTLFIVVWMVASASKRDVESVLY